MEPPGASMAEKRLDRHPRRPLRFIVDAGVERLRKPPGCYRVLPSFIEASLWLLFILFFFSPFFTVLYLSCWLRSGFFFTEFCSSFVGWARLIYDRRLPSFTGFFFFFTEFYGAPVPGIRRFLAAQPSFTGFLLNFTGFFFTVSYLA